MSRKNQWEVGVIHYNSGEPKLGKMVPKQNLGLREGQRNEGYHWATQSEITINTWNLISRYTFPSVSGTQLYGENAPDI